MHLEQRKLDYIDLEYKKLRLLMGEQEGERAEWTAKKEREKKEKELSLIHI